MKLDTNNLHDMRQLGLMLDKAWHKLPTLPVGRGSSTYIVLGRPQVNNLNDWPHVAYSVKLHTGRSVYETTYKAGLGIHEIPTATAIFGAIVNDARSVVGETFETWADNMGLDTDSRKAEETFNACLKVRLWLECYIGLGVMLAIYETDPEDTSAFPAIELFR